MPILSLIKSIKIKMSSIAPKIFYKAENMVFQVLSFWQDSILGSLKVPM